MNQETVVQRRIMLALSEAGCIIWRNEVSGAWVGKVIHKDSDQVTLSNARMIRFGLAIGSSDLIGVAPNGQFLAVEVKTKTGRASKEQTQFIKAVRATGGIAGIARSPQEALELIAHLEE